MPVLRRLLISATPIAAVSAVLYSEYKGQAQFGPLLTRAFAKTENNPNARQWSEEFNKMFPRKEWIDNWDFRDPHFILRNYPKYEAATEVEREELEKELTPKATRFIYLVRHGQYDYYSERKHLTPLGQEQANLIGERLRNLPVKFSHLTFSTATRATETAKIILKLFPELLNKSDSIIVEGSPYPPTPMHPTWEPEESDFYEDGLRMEAAFRKYIHRAHPKQTEASHEIIVCHGNLIRFFVCRALQLPPEAWLRMNLGNCSLTILQIRKDGQVSVKFIGDVGHLPPEMNTDN